MSEEFNHTVIIRSAKAHEIRKYDLGGSDVFIIVEVDGEIVGWCDDYGTLHPLTGMTDRYKSNLENVLNELNNFISETMT